jgi:hypothetical protein
MRRLANAHARGGRLYAFNGNGHANCGGGCSNHDSEAGSSGPQGHRRADMRHWSGPVPGRARLPAPLRGSPARRGAVVVGGQRDHGYRPAGGIAGRNPYLAGRFAAGDLRNGFPVRPAGRDSFDAPAANACANIATEMIRAGE